MISHDIPIMNLIRNPMIYIYIYPIIDDEMNH